jgi:hypothetical protein
MSVALERLARNQVLFREVNERLREQLDESAGGRTEFLCECSNTDCLETVALDPPEYERIRSKGNQFVITPGHEIHDIEKVVWESDRYFLVAKINGADYAEQTDPRSRAEG